MPMISSPEHFFVSPDGLLVFSMLAQVISTRISQPSLPRKNMNLHYSIFLFWTNFWQPTVHVQKNIFEKNLIKAYSPHLYASFGTFLRPNCSIIRNTVSIWSMFENRQIALIEGKCRRFRNSSDCLKTHCVANNWPIWTQNVPKEA